MMISDQLCQLMADVVTSRPTTAEALNEVHEQFLAIGEEWSATQDVSDSVRVALLAPDTLSLSELDRAACHLRQYVREVPALQSRLASLSLLLTLLGGLESRPFAGHYYVTALYPPASINLEPSPPAASRFGPDEFQLEGPGGMTILCGEDGKIDQRVITACELARNVHDAYWSAENVLLDLPQADTHFGFWCEQADALRRDWNSLLDCVCGMWALTPAGRLAKARLAEYLTKTELVGPEQDDGLKRLIDSMGRDLDRSKRQGWLHQGSSS